MAFEMEEDELSWLACESVVKEDAPWEVATAEEMILAQAECHYIMSQIETERLTSQNQVIAFAQPQSIDEGDDDDTSSSS